MRGTLVASSIMLLIVQIDFFALNLALPLFVGGIDWRAHIGGLAGGILIAWLWSVLAVGKPNARAIRTVTASAVAIAAIAATIAL